MLMRTDGLLMTKSKFSNKYQGAFVQSGKQPPVGNLVSFDFASMYPSSFGDGSKTMKELEQEIMERDILDKLDKLGL
jgi:hypothetical protein